MKYLVFINEVRISCKAAAVSDFHSEQVYSRVGKAKAWPLSLQESASLSASHEWSQEENTITELQQCKHEMPK